MKMPAVWYETQGDARAVLRYGEREVQSPGEGEVRVRLHASAVNPSDVKKRAGAQPVDFEDGFVIPHSDGAGVVDAVGRGVDESRIGERVWVYQAQFARSRGTAARYVTLPSALAAGLPDSVGFDVGACIGIPVMTAHRCVHNAGDLNGRDVLVTGASGRVGYYAAQWAGLAGARVIATAGSDARCEIAAQTGADHVFNYRRDDWAEAIDEITDRRGLDHIVDVEFGINVRTCAALLKTNGTISTYSSSLAPEPSIPFYPLMFKNISLHLVLVYNMPQQARQSAIDDIYRALSEQRLKHRIAETWPLKETAGAHESIEEGGRNGCVIIGID